MARPAALPAEPGAPLRPGNPVSPGSLAGEFCRIRAITEALAAPLTPEDCQVQSMPDASPAKWHLAHTSWFFETFVLQAGSPEYAPFHPGFGFLFNSYYQAVGEMHARPRRGLLTRPSLDEVRSYRRHVDAALLAFLETQAPGPWTDVVELGLNHEQQHQELMLTDLKHLFFQNPLRPAYRPDPEQDAWPDRPLDWTEHPGGDVRIGHDGGGFAFDNERPAHVRLLRPYRLATRPVTNGEFLEFIAAGGYRQPANWLADGWEAVRRNGWQAPLYWEAAGSGWREFTLAGTRPLEPAAPVRHVSYYEADAYARWAGARLPGEDEWEAASGAAALPGPVWEWTRSAYAPYPGYAPAAGALGEYNGKFMCNQVVLRGGSCSTPAGHIRATYRNFFYPDARWQFSGLRLAQDA